MKQQTAVEWLSGIDKRTHITIEEWQQAKEMEKEKMNLVWNDSRTNLVRSSNGFDFYTSFEDYYNETFKTK
jgi:hypothetical protein